MPFVVVGLASGSLYGIASMGLVLTYKTSGIFNFAHGAVAAGAAFIFYELHVQHGLPWPITSVLVVFVAAPVAGVVIERLARELADVPTVAKIVGTVGLLLVIQGLATTVYGHAALSFPTFLPSHTFEVFGVYVGYDQLTVVVLAAFAAGGLYAFFQFSRLGMAMRAVVDDPELLELAATDTAVVRRWSWVIGSAFAAISGVLLAPMVGLDAVLLTLLVVQAFGAAAVGAFANLPLVYAGGLLIGVGGSLANKYVSDFPALAGFPPSFPFLVLFVALLVTPRRLLVDRGAVRRTMAARRSLSSGTVFGGRVALVAALLLIPHVVGARLPVYTSGLIFVLIFLSLQLLVRTSGQVSLCHAAFAAVGAASFSHLAVGMGLPWGLALLGAGLAAVPVGAIVAVPAIRLSGLFLALATLGFGVLLQRMAFDRGVMFGATGSRQAPRPDIAVLSGGRGFYYVVLAVVIVACALVMAVHRSRLGQLLRALADSPLALSTQGADVNVTRVLVFCISAFLAGVAGALFGALSGSISGSGFGVFASITWLAVLAISGPGELSSAFLAPLLLAVVPSYIDDPTFVDLQPVAFGVLAILAAVGWGGRLDLGGRFRVAAARTGDRRHRSPVLERGRQSTPAPKGVSG